MKHLVSKYSVDMSSKVCFEGNRTSENWRSPLELAAIYGHCHLIDWLIDSGAALTSEPLVACMRYTREPSGTLLQTVRHMFNVGLVVDTEVVIATSHYGRWLTDLMLIGMSFPGSWWVDGAKAAVLIAEKIKNESSELLPLFLEHGRSFLDHVRDGDWEKMKIPLLYKTIAKAVLEWMDEEQRRAHACWRHNGTLLH
jgi:hypothetical protein